MRKIKDLTGKRFEKILVLGLDVDRINNRVKKDGKIFYKCLCDCGNLSSVRRDTLLRGESRSCGCLQKEIASKICSRKRLLFGEVSVRSLFYHYKFKAKSRNLYFGLSLEDFKKITQLNCFFCGLEPKQKYTQKKFKGDFYIYNGIDRLNSDKGYVLSNIVPCCGFCNRSKYVDSCQKFIENIKRIHKYLTSKNFNLNII